MTDQFAELDNYNPDPFSELDNYDPTPKPAGLGTRAVNTAQALGRLAYDTPGNLASYAANLSEGSRPLDKTNWADQATADATQRLNERTSAPDANDPILPFGTKSDVAQVGVSVPFSVGSMGAALGAGGLTTAITKNPFAGYAAGAGAAGSLAYRADTSMFMNSAIDAFTTDYKNKNNGQAPSRDLLLAEQERLQPYAQDHGLWEALPEAAGSVVGGKIVSSVFKGTGNLAWKAGKIAAGLALEELPTETITQHGQHNTEIDAGIMPGEKRSFTSPSDISTSFGEVVKPVLLQSMLMGGGGSAVKAAYDYAAARKQKLVETALSGPLGRASANGGFTNDGDHLADSNLDLRTDEQKAQDNASVIDSTTVNTNQSPTLHTSSYDNLFQQAESNYGLPAGLLSTMGFHESGFDPNAVSPIGARGVMQFMPATAQEYGIDPQDTPAAINAAGKKMAGLVKRYNGDMAKAVAAYNYGEGNLDKAIRKAGDNWLSATPRETQDYLSRILGGQQPTSANNNPNTQSEATQLDPSLNALVADDQLQGTPNPDNVINNSADAAYSLQLENLNGGQESTSETQNANAQEEGLLGTVASEQLGATPNLDTLAEQLHIAIATDTSKQPDQHYAEIVDDNKLDPQQATDLITKYQGIAEQQQRQDEQANQQTETQAQDQTSADQSTAVTFQPTHTLEDGTPVISHGIGEGFWNDKEGNGHLSFDAKPIGKVDTATTDTSTDVAPSDATAPLLNKRTNQPFTTQKLAEAAIASSSNPTVNQQDHIAVPVDGGFGIVPKPNTTQGNNDTATETQSVLSNTITNATGVTASAPNDVAGQASNATAQEVDKHNKELRHKPEGGVSLRSNLIPESNNILYRPDRAYRAIGTGGYNDFLQNKVIRSKLDGKTTYENDYYSKGSTENRYTKGDRGKYVVEAVTDHQWNNADNGYLSAPKNITENSKIRIHERQADGSYKTVFDNINDQAYLNRDATAQATEAVAQPQELADLSNNDQANKQPWEMTHREYGQHKDKEHEARRLENLAKVDADLDTLKNKGEGYDELIAKETAKVAHTITPEGKFSHNLRSGSRVYNSAHDFVHTQLYKRWKNTESHNGKFRSSFATDALTHLQAIQKAIDTGKTIPQNVLDSLNQNAEKLKYPSIQETAKKPDWEMTRDEYKNSFDPRDYNDANYDRMIHGAVFNEKITQAEADKKLIRDYSGNKYHWAKTRKELEQEKKEAVKNAKAARAEGNKNPIHSVKWAQKSDSNTAKNNITSTNLHHNKLLEVHQERVQEALSEGKSVPQEVLADYPDLQAPAQETANPIHDTADVSKKGENVDTYHQQTIDEFLSDAKKELGADFDGLKPSLINEHYQAIEDHIKDGGKISQAVYDSLESGKQHHFNKSFGAENVIDDGTRQAELDKLNKISDSKLAKDNEAKAQEEKEFADKKNAVALHQADETVRMAQYDVDHYGASESNQLKLDQAIKSRDALVRADNATKPEWHIDIPEQGLAILPAELKGEGYRAVAGRIAKDAVDAITQNQKIANDTLYLYFLPAAENYNAIARYFPEDQKPGGSWQISDSQGVRAGSLTNDQLLYKTESIMGNKPILGWEKTPVKTIETKQEEVASTLKPALGNYIQPKATANAEDQKRLANRGSRIATLSGLNDAIRKSNPDHAYSDSEIQSAADEKIDAGIDWLISKQQPTKKLTTKGTVVADKAEAITQSKSATENIQDLGEKIGGARKDTSNKTGPTGTKKAVDDRPTWAKRFSITELTQVGGLVQADDGKWIIRDSKSKDWRGQARALATFDTEQEAKDALPLLAVAIKHRVTTGSKDENGDYNYEIWRNINERKRVKVVDKSFKTREEAMQYMAQNAQAILETNTTFGESDLPVPENKQRTGKAHRDGDVNGESFMHTFGIRGVEFGNWNNQDERQEVMNAAYDGLMDLSEVLSIPPTAIGLNGELALAFGARGAGLSSAKAHYELQKSVINLTKMNGAGALAHEWLHALDHYLGRLDGKADANWVVAADGTRSFKITTAEDSFVSSGFKRNSGVREALRDAFKHVMETIFHKAETYISDTKQADNFVARTKEGLANELDRLRKDLSQQKDIQYYKRNNKPASAEQLIEFDTVASQLLNGDALETQFVLNEKQTRRLGMAGRQTNEQLDKISAIYKAVRGRSGFDATHQNGVMDRIRQSMRLYDQRLQQLAFANSTEEKIKKVPTSFAMDAKELDQGRGGDYWTTAHEMAARAFQGYVEDKMAEQAGRNPFLNYAPANFKMATPWGGKRVFPHGEERKAINAAFDKFVAILETKETDKGTALFSKSTTPVVNPHSKTSLNQAVTKAMDTLFGQGWTNRLMATGKFKVISRDEAVQIAGSTAANAKGFFNSDTDTTYLVHDNMTKDMSDKAIQGLLLHEISTHALTLGKSNEVFKDILKKVESMYKNGNPNVAEGHRRALLAFGLNAAPSAGVAQGTRTDTIKNSDILTAKSFINKITDDVRTITSASISRGMFTNSGQHSSSVTLAGANSLSDFFNSSPVFFHANGEINIETFDHMLSLMVSSSHNNEVLKSVIRFAPIDVVDMLLGRKTPAQVLLHNKAMFVGRDSTNAINNSIPASIYASLNIALAMSKFSSTGLRAKSSLAVINGTGESIKDSSANLTGNITSGSNFRVSEASSAGSGAKLTIGENLNATFDTIINRHAVTPNSDGVLDGVGVDAPSSSTIITPELFWEEVLAYAIESHPRSSLAQRIVEWFRQAVRALGKTLPVLERAKFSQWANKLTEAELIGMATSALKSAPDSLQFDNVGREKENIKYEQQQLDRKYLNHKQANDEIPELTAAAKQFKAGEISRDEWDAAVVKYKPVSQYTEIPALPSFDRMEAVLKGKQKTLVDWAIDNLKTGDWVRSRLDIPAYTREVEGYGGGTAVVTLHTNNSNQTAISYQSTVILDDVSFHIDNEAFAQDIATYDKGKYPLATIIGKIDNVSPEEAKKQAEAAMSDPSWVQVGMDPRRHANFYTRKDMTPVISGDRAIQVGMLILVKNPIYADRSNFKFSRSTPSNTPADNSAMRSFFAPALGKQALGWLAGLFQRNHLIDFVAQDLPELINYKLLSQEKDNFTNQRENEIGKSYKEMLDKMDAKTMHELGRVQGMATRLVKFDPALADNNTPMTEEELAAYDAYTAMPESAKEAYATMRKAYQDDLTEKKEALEERIKAFPADKETQAEIISTIQKHFDQFKEGVYFPLNRDGSVIVKATNADGELVIEHVATQADAYKLVKEMTAQGYDNTHIIGKDAYDRDLLAGNAANEMAALAHKTISDLKEKSIQGKLTESDFNDLFSEFNQLLINTLPDSSYRKHFIHRKGTLGESTDTLRAYSKTRVSAVKMIASLTYDHQIQDVLNNADKAIKEMDKVAGSDTLAIKSIVNELKLREAALKSTEINAVSQVLTSLGFMGALGLNIGSAAVNMLQVVGVALPELIGRHGEVEAMKEIASAYKLLFNPANLDKASGLDITKNPHLTAIAKQAMEYLVRIGKIDLTMTHDSIAAGKDPSYSSNPATRAFGAAAKYSGYFFHVAEAANRQITGMAAFNLAYKKNGGNFEAAIAEAVDVIDRTQFDYGQGNRARYMMSNTARVLTLFKAYALGMSYFIGRNAYQYMKGETPEVRLQARKTLIASMAMSFATAGLFGMPIGIEAFAGIGGVAAFKYKGANFAVPGAIGGMLIFQALLAGLGADDEDELETEFRNWLTDNFDQTTAEWVTKGPARLLPIGDIASRTSQSELWWRSQNKQLEGTDQYNAIATALIGPIGSQVAGLFTAKKMYEDGQYSRMVESMSPAFLRNAIAANRMGSEGVTNLKGDKIIQRDLTPVELINKVIGFNPTVVTNTYDANSAIAKESTKHTLAKSHLTNRWMSGDATERSDLMKGAIKDFNESVPPSERITLKSLFKSMRSRKGIDKHTKNGLYLSKKQNYLRDIGRFNRQE